MAFLHQKLLHQEPFTPHNCIPEDLYTKELSHQNPETFLRQKSFTSDTVYNQRLYANHLLLHTTLRPEAFYSKHLLHQKPFTRSKVFLFVDTSFS